MTLELSRPTDRFSLTRWNITKEKIQKNRAKPHYFKIFVQYCNSDWCSLRSTEYYLSYSSTTGDLGFYLVFL